MAKSKGDAGAAGDGVNKTRMVEEAVQELGNAPPKEIRKYISDKYGVDMSPTMISSYKSNILRKQGQGQGRKTGGGKAAGDVSVGVRDLTALRDLIDRVGASQVQALVKVLSR